MPRNTVVLTREWYDAGVLRRWLAKLGPGLVTGASDDDPSGIATYAVAGAAMGYATLWTALWTLPLMVAVQLICARIGMVTGVGLSQALGRRYPRWLLYAVCGLLAAANVFNIGADLGGMADAIAMLTGVRPLVTVPVLAVAIVVFTVVAKYATFARYVKLSTLSLFAYIFAAVLARPDWRAGLTHAFVPDLHWSADYFTTIVAILGTTISPYLFFWQASQEVEAEKALGRRTVVERRGVTRDELADARADVVVGMSLSNSVQYFIILATASTLFRAGRHDIQTTRQAAEALRPLAGDGAYVLFALGLVGSGLLAIPILAGSASFAIAELRGWKSGLDEPFRRARRFYVVFGAAVVVGMWLDVFSAGPIRMLYYSAIVNGLAAPPLLVLIMRLSNDRRVMRGSMNSRTLNALGWTATALMTAAAVALIAAAVAGR